MPKFGSREEKLNSAGKERKPRKMKKLEKQMAAKSADSTLSPPRKNPKRLFDS